MGSIIGGIIGGIGSISAAHTANQGFRYAKNNLGSFVSEGRNANTDISDLLTNPNANSAAFKNYLNSTGYKFQLQQGTQAISGSAASRGLLNSGGTAKALLSYGQGLAGNYFQSYLQDLGAQADRGLVAGKAITDAGVQSAAGAAKATQNAFSSIGSGIGDIFNLATGGTG